MKLKWGKIKYSTKEFKNKIFSKISFEHIFLKFYPQKSFAVISVITTLGGLNDNYKHIRASLVLTHFFTFLINCEKYIHYYTSRNHTYIITYSNSSMKTNVC